MTDDNFPRFGRGRHLLSVAQLDREGLEELFDLADLLAPIARRERRCTVLDGAVLGSLFFEPSTRTRLSFETAFLRLGGEVTTTTGFTFSSMAKGESIADTSRVVSGYSDVMVVRHPDEGSVAEFAASSVVPVLSGGDGAGEHPSQALLDTYTMEKELQARGKTVSGSTIAVLGDLKHGRTVHSLVKLLALYDDMTFHLFAPPSLEMPDSVVRYASERGHTLHTFDSVEQAVHGASVVYATRVQRERMTEEVLASANMSGNLLNREILARAGAEDIVIMHPLPRDARPDAYDLSSDVDDLPGLAIFHQTDNGVTVRMAMFVMCLGVTREAIHAATKNKVWDASLS